MNKKKLLVVLPILMLFSFTIVSSTTSLQEELTMAQEEFIVPEKECNSFLYSTVLKIIKDFTFEVITYDTEEHFYVTLLENDCEWSYEVSSEYSRPDATVYFNYLSEDGVSKVKYHTLKGFLLYNLLKGEIKNE